MTAMIECGRMRQNWLQLIAFKQVQSKPPNYPNRPRGYLLPQYYIADHCGASSSFHSSWRCYEETMSKQDLFPRALPADTKQILSAAAKAEEIAAEIISRKQLVRRNISNTQHPPGIMNYCAVN